MKYYATDGCLNNIKKLKEKILSDFVNKTLTVSLFP